MSDYMNNEIVTKKIIMELYGLTEYEAAKIIRKVKYILVMNGYDHYNNRRIGKVPHAIVKQVLAIDNDKVA